MKIFIKLFITTTLIASSFIAKTTFADTSVWKVSKGNDHIYIGGTVHILPISEFPLPEEFTTAYKNTDTIVLEAKLPDPTDTSFQTRLMKKMAYTDGTTLSSTLSKETYKNLSNYLTPFGIDLKQLNGYKPGLIVMMMAAMEAQRVQIAGEGVDLYFNKLAIKDKKAIEYLETVNFQLELLAKMGKGNEETLIKSSLSQMNEFKTVFSQLIAAWRAGDTEQLAKLLVDKMNELDPNTLKTALFDRNQNWLPLIEKMFLDDDKEFVLVGAVHLVGKLSVIDLLKNKGYQIEKL